jgi:hypothetical protein
MCFWRWRTLCYRFPVMADMLRKCGIPLRVIYSKQKTENRLYILYLPKSSGSRPSKISVHFLASSVVMASLAVRSTRRAF